MTLQFFVGLAMGALFSGAGFIIAVDRLRSKKVRNDPSEWTDEFFEPPPRGLSVPPSHGLNVTHFGPRAFTKLTNRERTIQI